MLLDNWPANLVDYWKLEDKLKDATAFLSNPAWRPTKMSFETIAENYAGNKMVGGLMLYEPGFSFLNERNMTKKAYHRLHVLPFEC